MPKKKRHGGIVSCDPSFKGCAITVYCPVYGYISTHKYDIRGDVRDYEQLPNITVMVGEMLLSLIADTEPFIFECDLFAIEGQFCVAMKRLRDVIAGQIVMAFQLRGYTPPRIESVSAVTWRGYFDLGAESYRKRKLRSVEYFSENPQLIGWSPDIKDDDRAECLLILNYLVQRKKLIFTESVDVEMNGQTGPRCDECGTFATIKTKKDGSKSFWACPSWKTCSKAKSGGWLSWVEEAPAHLGKRNPTPEIHAVPSPKKAYTQAPPKIAPSTEQLLAKVVQLLERSVDMDEYIKNALAVLVTNTNTIVNSQAGQSLPSDDEQVELYSQAQ